MAGGVGGPLSTTVERLTDSPGAAIATSTSVMPETVRESVPCQLVRDPALQPPVTPSAWTLTLWMPAAIGPKFTTPVL